MSLKLYQSRILRNFHNLPPTKFHAANQRVRNGITQQTNLPDPTWAANPTLLPSYLAASDKYDTVYHEASHGSRVVIAERDILQAQIIIYLDEIAAVLEAAAVRNPEILLTCGFDLTKERRSRTKTPLPVSDEAKAINTEHSS